MGKYNLDMLVLTCGVNGSYVRFFHENFVFIPFCLLKKSYNFAPNCMAMCVVDMQRHGVQASVHTENPQQSEVGQVHIMY